MRAFLASAFAFTFGSLSALPVLAACERVDLIAQMPAEERAALYEQVAQIPYAEGNLWQASKPGSEITVVGTFHMSDPRHDGMMQVLTPMLPDLDALYVEANLEDGEALEFRMATDPSYMFITEGPSLLEQLEPEVWEALTAAMAERNIPGFMVAKMQPWFAGLTLSMSPCTTALMQSDPEEARNGLDQRLMEAAARVGLVTHSLEDAEETIGIFTKAPMEEQLENLELALVMDQDSDAQFGTLREAYFRGQHGLIWTWSMAQARAHPQAPDSLEKLIAEFEADLLTNRNAAWIDVLRTDAQEGRFMVAVGAAHLFGENGVLNLLAQEGYALVRLD